nr:hypothetical protein [Tanacetum cinerariifolium]
DGSVHQSGPSHSLDQPEVDEQIPTSGFGSDLQGSGNDGLITATPIDENTSSEGNAFKIKYKYDGEVDRFKARLVAKGFGQKEGLDYDDTFSPVVKMGTVRCLLSLAVQNEWDIYQIDINNVFLYGDLIEEVYMLPPPGFFDPSDMCTSKVEIAKFKHFLSNRFKIKDLGELKYFLGIEVLKVSGGLCLSQRRPDISYVVHCLSQHMHAPLKSHFDIALRLLKYLKLAPGFEGLYQAIGCLLMVVWFLGKERSKLPCPNLQQKLNIMSMAAATCEIMWIVKIMSDLNIRNLLPAELYCDNKAAMQIAANLVMHEKTKHFDLDVHFIREKVCSGLIKTVNVESKDNVADILTKALGSFQRDFLTKKFGA